MNANPRFVISTVLVALALARAAEAAPSDPAERNSAGVQATVRRSAALASPGESGATYASEPVLMARVTLPIEPRRGDGVRAAEPRAHAGDTIPDPGGWALVLAGMIGAIAIARRRMGA